MESVGRNDPCPCGSGKKYKYCHLVSDRGTARNGAADLNDVIAEELAGREFHSLEDLQAHLDELTNKYNHRPVPAFLGLSPDQMMRLHYEPLSATNIFTVPKVLESDPSAQVSDLFMFLAEELKRGPLKLTEKGNLPRAFVRAAADLYEGDEKQSGPFYMGPYTVHKESDFKALEVMRHTAQMAGLIRKHKKRLHLTQKANKLLDDHGVRGIYPALLRAYVGKYNWAFADRYEPLDIVQRSWAFSLYLLTRFGNELKPTDYYADLFLEAFPSAMDEVYGHPFREPYEVVSRCFTLRTLERFAEFFGLVRVEFEGEYRVMAATEVASTALLRDAVRFVV